MSDTVVIGGGIAGLTVASELHAAGRSVVVLERSESVGGAMQTVEVDGFRIEEGPNSLQDRYPDVTTLLERVGLADDRVFVPDSASRRYVVRDGRLVQVPLSPGQFITSPLFSPRAKLRLLREPFVSPRNGPGEESIAAFVRRRLGREILNYAADPFVAGVYAGDPEQLSVRLAFPALYNLEQRYGSLIKGQIRVARERRKENGSPKPRGRLYSFREGMHALPKALATRLGDQVRTRATVTEVRREKGKWVVSCSGDSQSQDDIVCRSLVYTGRLSDISTILWEGTDGSLLRGYEVLGDVRYPPVTVLGLGFRKEDVGHALYGFGALVPKVEKRNTLGVLFSSSMFSGRAPEGHVLLTVFVGGARQPNLAHRPSGELLQLVMNDLQDLLAVQDDPVMVHRRTWNHAIPQYDLDYSRVLAAVGELEENIPGLFFAGNYRNGVSVPDTIGGSLSVAERVQDFLHQSHDHD